MNIVVTGGDGFIGSHLCDRLEEDGHDVVVIDDHSTSDVRRSNEDLDATDEDHVDMRVREAEFVFHLAHVVGVKNVYHNVWWTLWSGLMATNQVVNSCLDWDVPLLYVSSSEVYGGEGHSYRRFSEDPRLVYPISKLAGELLVRTNEDLDWRIARVFNTTGPRQLPAFGMVVPNFIKSALKGESLKVFGDGTDVRYFAHVHDTVDQLICMMKLSSGLVWDVGDLIETTVLDLAEMVIDLTGSSSEVEFVERPYGREYRALSRRKPEVEARGTHDLESLLEDTIEWWTKNPQLWED